MQVEPEG